MAKTFEPLGKWRKEYGEAIGRVATERAGASESNRNQTKSTQATKKQTKNKPIPTEKLNWLINRLFGLRAKANTQK